MGGLEGALVTPHVRLARRIGQGGMGSVWAAEHTTLGIEVAVKLVSAERLAADELAVARFEREAALAARIDDPHAVRVYDHGVMADGTPFMVMELLRGETLSARLRRQERLDTATTVALVSQLAGVLGAAHELGIVHRDIKPDNVYLVESRYEVFVKLLDFGIARCARTDAPAVLTAIGAVVGTPHYMSPEQLLATGEIDQRADLWSLAVVAYQALTGTRPFDGASMAALSLAICHGEYAHPSQLLDGVPASLDAWFARAFSVTPADRFGSAREQARALREALGTGLELVPRPERLLPRGSSGPEGGAPSLVSTSVAAVTKAVAAPRPLRRAATWGLAAGALLVSAAWWMARGAADARASSTLRVGERAAASAVADQPSADRHAGEGGARSAPLRSAPVAPPTPPAKVVSSGARSTPARPAYCDSDAGYTTDADGHLLPKPECLHGRAPF
jgi:serine/threonine-protein kinase